MAATHPSHNLSNFLRSLGSAGMTASAYDTAWIARLGDLDRALSDQALDWLRANQLHDGSWGNSYLEHHHERLVCTLSALVALASRGCREDRQRIEKAQAAMRAHEGCLQHDAWAMVGFEMIVPALVEEAEALGIYQRSGSSRLLEELSAQRDAKLARLPDGLLNRTVSHAYSTEMVGKHNLHILDADDLQEQNGSVAYSPSATAFYALYVRPGDAAALGYLNQVAVRGAVPTAAPIDVFEVAWAIWNLALGGMLAETPMAFALAQPSLDFLERCWTPGRGIGYTSQWIRTDGDCTGLVYEVLTRFGRSADLADVLSYEAEDGFLTLPYESGRSLSANIHILGALSAAGFDVDARPVQKILGLLARTRTPQGYWYDKWHASPYYPTAHGIIACLDYAPALVEDALRWIVAAQNRDGSWGYFLPTAEETAYALQALVMARRCGYAVPAHAIRRGAAWLAGHADDPYVPLWIGKSLYTPIKVVESTILSALLLAEQASAPGGGKAAA